MIDVLQCGTNNTRSVLNALQYLNIGARMLTTPDELSRSSCLIFPGVGNFGHVSRNLQEKGLWEMLKTRLREGLPFLGICLGMQLLFETSEEAPGSAGLGLLPGAIEKLRHPRIPQIGWNRVLPTGLSPLLEEGDAYFVNSFVLFRAAPDIITARSDYGGLFVSAIQKDAMTGVQFHPEKSGPYGLRLLEAWCRSRG